VEETRLVYFLRDYGEAVEEAKERAAKQKAAIPSRQKYRPKRHI
jgi:hypothetical protein